MGKSVDYSSGEENNLQGEFLCGRTSTCRCALPASLNWMSSTESWAGARARSGLAMNYLLAAVACSRSTSFSRAAFPRKLRR
jgi:hypothetical protein